MAKSINDILMKMEQDRLHKIEIEKIKEQEFIKIERQRQEYFRSMRMYEKMSINSAASSAAGGGSISRIENNCADIILGDIEGDVACVGNLAEFSITISGGTSPYSVQVTSGNLPVSVDVVIYQHDDMSIILSEGDYEIADTYVFTLMVSDSDGCSTSQEYTIVVHDPLSQPEALFDADSYFGNTNTLISFIDQSLNDPTSWLWTFTAPLGGGFTSSEQNPSATFSELGFWSVSLAATNIAGTGTLLKKNFIDIYEVLVSPTVALADHYLNHYNFHDQDPLPTYVGSGGTAPYTYSLSGDIPGNVTIDDEDGTISGILNGIGLFIFNIIATDIYGVSGFLEIQITVLSDD